MDSFWVLACRKSLYLSTSLCKHTKISLLLDSQTDLGRLVRIVSSVVEIPQSILIFGHHFLNKNLDSDPDDADFIAGEKLSPGEKAKIVHFVIDQNHFQLGKKFCKTNHLKKPCHSGRSYTINHIIQKYYQKTYPEFCEKWVKSLRIAL